MSENARREDAHSLNSYRALLSILFLGAVDLFLFVVDWFFDLGLVEAVDNGVFSLGYVDWRVWLVTRMGGKLGDDTPLFTWMKG